MAANTAQWVVATLSRSQEPSILDDASLIAPPNNEGGPRVAAPPHSLGPQEGLTDLPAYFRGGGRVLRNTIPGRLPWRARFLSA